jgi:hypothetical protein
MELSEEDRIALAEANRMIGNAFEEGLRETMDVSEDWKLWDGPRVDIKLWNEFLEAIGDAPVRFISGSSNSEWVRCTMFLSPEALARIREHYK